MESTVKLSDLQEVFGQMREAFFFNTTGKKPSELTKADVAMPISDDGVTYEIGDPDITKKKIINGQVWYAIAQDGDANITFQVPSVADAINELFATKKGVASSATIGDQSYAVQGYSTATKKVEGAWFFYDEGREHGIYLPKTDNFGTFKGPQGDNWAYWNVAVTPYADAEGADMYIFTKNTTSSGGA